MRRPLFITGLVFVTGETAYRLWELYPIYSAVLIVGFLIIMIISNRYMLNGKKSINLLLFSCFIFGALWSFVYSYSGTDSQTKLLESRIGTGEKISLTGYIQSIQKSSSGYQLRIKCHGKKLLMYVDEDEMKETLEQGRYISIQGTVDALRKNTNPGEMDMEMYYLGQGISCQIDADHYETGKVCRYDLFILGRIRKKAGEIIDRYYSPENAAILKTMILGDRSELDKDTKLIYQRSGIAHILAISGLHIMLLAGILEWLMEKFWIKKKWAYIVSMGLLILYGLMTGMSQATMRAVIMLVIMRSSYFFRRTPDTPTCMMEALLIMIIMNPDCIFSTGLLMSFAAMAGIWTGTVFYDVIFEKERFLMLPRNARSLVKGMTELLVMSTAISLWMLPLVILNYIVTSLLCVVIVLCFVVILAGFLVSVSGSLVPASGVGGGWQMVVEILIRPAVWVSSEILEFYGFLCRLILKIPFSVVITGHIQVWQVMLYYGVLICILLALDKWVKRFKTRRGSQVECFEEKSGTWAERLMKGHESRGMDLLKGRGFLRQVFKEEHGSQVKRVEEENGSQGKSFEKENRDGGIKIKFLCMALYLLVASLLSLGLIWGVYQYNSGKNEVVFLDVGQGDGSLIRTSDGKNYIVDFGSSGKDELGRYTLLPALKYYGMSEVECIFISHTDSDHVSGLIYLLQNMKMYGIKVKYVAIAIDTAEDENLMKIKTAVDASKTTRLIELKKGDMVDGHFQVIYPSGDEIGEHGGNDYSLVLSFTDKKLEVLYTGDIGNEAEKNLASELEGLEDLEDSEGLKKSEDSEELKDSEDSKNLQESGNSDGLNSGDEGNTKERENAENDENSEKSKNSDKLRILKCAHHGSRFSSSEEFLKAYNPDITVISCGKNNRYGHPHRETLERLNGLGTQIYRTDQGGAVILNY